MDANYHYFRKGLDHMQTKLEQRQYLSVSAFATDLGAVFHDAVYSSSAEDEVPVKSGNELNSSELRAKQIATQKDKTVRAKRIIKSILREAQDAAAKECELGPKSADEERALVHTILDSCMRPGPNSTDYSVAEEGHESDGEGEAGLVLRPIANNRQAPSDGVAHDKAPQDVEMAVDEISDEMIQGEIRDGLPNGTLDAAASSVPAETAMTLHVPNGDHANICANEQLELESNGMSGLPALSNSGSTIPSTTHPDPPTPHGDKDAAEGGVPWYLEGFEPAGTTVLDEAWPGREALRGISEELSELDDEALNDLVVSQQRERSAVGSGGEGLTVPELKRRARPKRKRF
jgi:NuA3 HAT complex component NTO1